MDASAMKTLADVKMENIGYNSDRSVHGPQLWPAAEKKGFPLLQKRE